MNQQNPIGMGSQATVYRDQDTALKVFGANYPKALVFYEAMIMSFIEPSGLRLPKVLEVININGCPSIRMDFISGLTLHDRLMNDLANVADYVDKLLEVQLAVHAQKNIQLPAQLKARLSDRINNTNEIPLSIKDALLHQLEQLPEGNALCHGDFHGYNLIWNEEGCYIIDWIDATIGCAYADACRTYMIYLLHSELIANLYLERYCQKTLATKAEVIAWLPVVAAARLSEGHVDEKDVIFSWFKFELLNSQSVMRD